MLLASGMSLSNKLFFSLVKSISFGSKMYDTFYLNVLFTTVKPHKEESKKLRTNRLFSKILYPLDKKQCQVVSGKCS